MRYVHCQSFTLYGGLRLRQIRRDSVNLLNKNIQEQYLGLNNSPIFILDSSYGLMNVKFL